MSPRLAAPLSAAGLLLATATLAGLADPDPRPDANVMIRVAPSPGNQGMSVSARDAKGMEHALRMEAKDGRVIIHGEPDGNRPWLGVLLSDSEEVARVGSRLPTKERRWTITAVADDSPAKRAGLQRGDVITSVDGREILVDGPGMLKDRKPGDSVMFDIERDGSARRVRVKIGGHPGTVEFDDADGIGAMDVAGNMLGSLQGLEALKSLKELRRLPCPPGTKPEDCPGVILGLPFGVGPRLGVSVEPMSDQLSRFFGAQPGKGLLVKDVIAGTPAERGGIEAGDIILRVAGKDIGAPGDIRQALEGRDSGDTISVDLLRRGQPVTVSVTLDDTQKQGSLFNGFSPEVAERLAQATLEATNSLTDEQRVAIERAVAQVREAMGPQQRAEIEAAAQAAREALADVRTERRQAERELRAAERERRDAQRERERSGAAGAFDADARRELERSLQAQPTRVRPTEELIEF